MHRGYIRLWRKIQENFLWKEHREFSKAEAWIDILMEVRHDPKPTEIAIGMKVLICNQGESLYSLATWAKRWNWSKSKVRRVLKLFASRSMIVVTNETVTVRIKVCNYQTYNKVRNGNESEMKRKWNASETQVAPNKNEEERKNVSITAEEREILCHLNSAATKKFETAPPSLKALIKKYGAASIKKVVDRKCAEWLGTTYEKYLRPQTLFDLQKFEAYVNEPDRPSAKPDPNFFDESGNRRKPEEISKNLGRPWN